LPPSGSRSEALIPSTICRAMSAVLLLFLPISTVPRLPGEPVACGKRFASRMPSGPGVIVPESSFQVQLSAPLPAISAF